MEQKEIKDMIKEIVCMISGKKMEIEKRTGKNLSGKFKNKSDVMTVNGLTKLLL